MTKILIDKETVELALEALGPTAPECCGCAVEWEIAITALRQALENAELDHLTSKGKEAWKDIPNATQWIDELRGNEQSTEQEPVAWVDSLFDEIKHGDEEHQLWLYAKLKSWTPPAPQPQEAAPRKPLTDEEVEKIIKQNMSLQMNLAGIRADFEAAHGITGEKE